MGIGKRTRDTGGNRPHGHDLWSYEREYGWQVGSVGEAEAPQGEGREEGGPGAGCVYVSPQQSAPFLIPASPERGTWSPSSNHDWSRGSICPKSGQSENDSTFDGQWNKEALSIST